MDSFKNYDLVWAKMKGHIPWPGRVTKPTKEAMLLRKNKDCKNYKWIYFFGKHNYAWIKIKNLRPYLQYRNVLDSHCSTDEYLCACVVIDTHYLIEKEFNQLVNN